MKTTFRFIIAAMAAVAVFTSCQKELAIETANNTNDAVRVISAQFDNSTKASLNGLKPSFENGDKIRVSNTAKSEECTVSVSGTTASFTTTLSGTLTAIYPAAAAVLGSGEGQPIVGPYFKVSADQDGTVANAIIAKAEITEGSPDATFTGVTALFEITPPSGATNITITSLNKIDATTGQRSTTANAEAINTTGEDGTAKCKITVSVSGGTAYVSLVPGVNLTDLSFDAGEAAGLKGIPTSKLGGHNDVTAANAKYTIDSQNWHPYVEIQMNSKTYKWATMNIGATSQTDAGYYFFWGGTVGYQHNGSKWAKADVTPEEELTNGFTQDNDPHYSGSAYAKYTGTSGDEKTVLDLADDAANANWGGSWRMPTKEEFDALGSGTWVTTPGSGRQFGSSPNQIFLPAAGYGGGTGLSDAGVGYYWSSSLYTSSPISAYYLGFYDGYATTSRNRRYFGRSVRALSE